MPHSREECENQLTNAVRSVGVAELHQQQDRVLEDLRLRRVRFETSVRDVNARARLGVRRWLKQSRFEIGEMKRYMAWQSC